MINYVFALHHIAYHVCTMMDQLKDDWESEDGVIVFSLGDMQWTFYSDDGRSSKDADTNF